MKNLYTNNAAAKLVKTVVLLWALPAASYGQISSGLQGLTNRIPVGDPAVLARDYQEGPKGIATADFNQDGKPDIISANLDGTLSLIFATTDGKFLPARHIRTGAEEFRAVIAANFNTDAFPDIAAASPMDGKLVVYLNDGSGNFADQLRIPAWVGVRNLAVGDFDGDGKMDLAAAGPGVGLRHYRNTGNAQFQAMGDVPQLIAPGAELPRPVYTLRTLRSLDGLRDDLLATHAESSSLYIISTKSATLESRATEPALPVERLSAWRTFQSPLILSEAQITNTSTLAAADGSYGAWVEIFNRSATPISLENWTIGDDLFTGSLPATTLAPGRFTVVFLTGRASQQGAHWHSSLTVNSRTLNLHLTGPEGQSSTLPLRPDLPPNTSWGLPMDASTPAWFDLPSPGHTNNASLKLDSQLDGSATATDTTLAFDPPEPTAADAVTVTVNTPEVDSSFYKLSAVWLSVTEALEEKHYLLKRMSPGVHVATLPPGTVTLKKKHRVTAKYLSSEGDDHGKQIHPGMLAVAAVIESQPGALKAVASIPSPEARSFEIASISQLRSANAAPDLIYADDVCGLVRVHRAANTLQRFEPWSSQDLQVRGSPRDVKLLNLDGDDWLDAVVVLRNMNILLSYTNQNGTLKLTGELPTGNSPREAAVADFNTDGLSDIAVINRVSADVSIIVTAPGIGLVSSDQIYPVDGQVSGIIVQDQNADGRADVMQLHQSSGEISLRLAQADGKLGPAVFNQLPGARPSSFVSADVNNDGVLDVISVNLGRPGHQGSISVKVSRPDGGFETSNIMASSSNGLFAIQIGHFDADAHLDLVVGLFDCQVVFYQGDGLGGFRVTQSVPFVYESRVMVADDIDQDGDTDLLGAGMAGDVIVLENKGTFHSGPYGRTVIPPPNAKYYGSERISSTHLNGDEDPDLIVGTANGCMVLLGGPGATFVYDEALSKSTPNFDVSDFAILDLDGNGTKELVTACRQAACINISTQMEEGGEFKLVSQATVPSVRFLGTGDIDGDGKPDLVGTGDVLWTVLSSTPPNLTPPRNEVQARALLDGVRINEVLSRNTNTRLSMDDGRTTDFVELFNSSPTQQDVSGWTLSFTGMQSGVAFNKAYTLPAGTFIMPGGRHIVLCGLDTAVNDAYTGFTLPAESTTITLARPDGSEADRTVTPEAQNNVSWARFQDAHERFRSDGIPSPGLPNVDNGAIPPDIKLMPMTPATLRAGQPIVFRATAYDDMGVLSLTIVWKPVGSDATPERVNLFDDGMHGDGAAGDGNFAGVLAPGLPAGAEIQFYLEGLDLANNVARKPDSATLTGPGEAPVAWTLSLAPAQQLAIVEISRENATIRDEIGGTPAYARIKNQGSAPEALGHLRLSKSPLSSTFDSFAFPNVVLPPGESIMIFLDDDVEDGPLHAPFSLNTDQETLALYTLTPSGARQWIQTLTIADAPPLTGLSEQTFQPLPGSTQLWGYVDDPDAQFGSATGWNANNALEVPLSFAYTWGQLKAGATYRLESLGAANAWKQIGQVTGNGTLYAAVRPIPQFSALRLTEEKATPTISEPKIRVGSSNLFVYVDSALANSIEYFIGWVDPGAVENNWNRRGLFKPLVPGSSTWVAEISQDRISTVLRIKANNAAGTVWSAALPLETQLRGFVGKIHTTKINTSPVSYTFAEGWRGMLGTSYSFYYGTQDKQELLTEWQHSTPAQFHSDSSSVAHGCTVTVQNLTPGVTYYGRFATTDSAGNTFLSPGCILFNGTPTSKDLFQANLHLTELMYHPGLYLEDFNAGFEEPDFEWIEFFNAGDQPLDLRDAWLEGIALEFPNDRPVLLEPRSYGIIASHPHAFAKRYGLNRPMLAWTIHPFRGGRLSNSGEMLKLYNGQGEILFSTSYAEVYLDDGAGHTLELNSQALAFENANAWVTSRVREGTPGIQGYALASQSYSEWTTRHFTPQAQASLGLGSADPDGDKIPNAQEYLQGSDPNQPNDSEIVFRLENDVVSFTLPVNPDAKKGIIRFQEQLPTSLWTDVSLLIDGVPPGYTPAGLYERADGRMELRYFRRRNPAASKEFFRLKFMSNP